MNTLFLPKFAKVFILTVRALKALNMPIKINIAKKAVIKYLLSFPVLISSLNIGSFKNKTHKIAENLPVDMSCHGVMTWQMREVRTQKRDAVKHPLHPYIYEHQKSSFRMILSVTICTVPKLIGGNFGMRSSPIFRTAFPVYCKPTRIKSGL